LPAAQRQAYAQAYERLKQGRSADEPRVLGLFDGLGQISDDFDASLPDEDLFWGGLFVEQVLDWFVLTANQGQHTGQDKEECQIDERLVAVRGGAEFNNHTQ
jgi:hypothetical protein